jgi:hypothetical protein
MNEENNKGLFLLADKLRAQREEKEEHSAIVKELNREIDETEEELITAMVDAECPNFTRGDKQFYITTKTYWSPEKDRKEELYSSLKENGYDHLFTVNSQTLTGFIREKVEETADENGETHVPDWLSGLVNSYEQSGITMKTATKKSK